ncbi:uncharacterized protein BO96DRAFT_351704 [Aspergillus niger CBS 101883]|uniref:Uncharacterized protein n=2 Tax=Aspergillus niger TaxID=5061 RepID=A2Q8N3_ASPNC|nr:uncharacterized protein BO96DRAFT_351704 [Aspergillus niger CBS 101883]XP_059599652.1 hypothetical protein An01g04960 [Aspergillus niger]PYH50840.1 hypothetical protein BO96DRAFT_351704 [Aspergillus niger CBS 101883]CAK37030.1 hypothetical protein An01g04960 [Aspergillus niger]
MEGGGGLGSMGNRDKRTVAGHQPPVSVYPGQPPADSAICRGRPPAYVSMIVIDTIERTLADQGVTLFAMVDALINGRSVCCSMFAGDFQSTDPSYLINSSEAVGLSVVLIVKLTLRSSRIDQGSSTKFRSINPPRNRSTRLARNPTPAISQQSWESGQAR